MSGLEIASAALRMPQQLAVMILSDPPVQDFWNENRIVAAIGILLAIAALVYAVIQHDDAKKAQASLTALQNQTSTKAIGRFPLNLDEITTLVSEAQDELMISTDYVGYAMYTDPARSKKYIDSLTAACNTAKRVRLIVYSHDAASKALSRQISSSTFSKMVGTDAYDSFTHSHSEDKVAAYKQFRSLIFRVESDIVGHLPHNLELRVRPERVSTFVWIATESNKLIFAHRNEGGAKAGLSFFTRDSDLASAHREIFEQDWEASLDPIDRRF